MWNRNYGKKLVCTLLSATMVLTLGSQTVLSTTMGTEDSLAGMSQTLDEYCENKQNGTAAPVAAPVSPAAVTPEQPAVTPEQPTAPEQPEATQAPVKKPSRLKNTGISIADEYVNIRKKPNTESKVVGKLYQGSAVKIEKRKGSWVKISSGNVTGYIKKEFLAIGKKAEKLEDKYGTKYAKVTTETLKVREKKNTNCTILTLVPEGERYLVKSQSKKWVKIEVEEGTVGYVSADYVKVYTRFKKAVSIEEEEAEARRKAEAAAAAAEAEAAERARQAAQSASRSQASRSSSSNRSSRSSSSSSSRRSSSSSSSSGSSSVSGGGSGSAIANYAVKFVGNPYSYGGTSLTNGADCSGFTMAVFRRFGISLPHGSGSQAGCGRKVSLSEAKPGDLVFYASGGRIHHVALYIGGGRIVHAKGKAYGIVTDSVGYNKVYCVRRVL